MNYKTGLEKEDKIRKRISKKTNKTAYFVPKRFHEKLEAIVARKKADLILNRLSTKEIMGTVDILAEIEMVMQSMTKMGYTFEEIKHILREGLEKIHSKLVNRIVKDAK